MSAVKSDTDELRKIIYEDNFSRDEALEFLDAIDESFDEMEKEFDELEDEFDELEKEFNELSGHDLNSEIDMGIGKLSYNTDGNILIEALMESLADKVEELGVQGVIDLLEPVAQNK